MSEVKRYILHMFDRYPADGSGERETHAEMRETARGEFAKFEDIEVICSENKLLRHEAASYLETVAKVCDMLGVDLESAKTAEGKPSDVLFDHAQKLSSDLDRVTAERDALQALLTAVDKRADVLEGLLRTSLLAMNRIYTAGRDFIVGAGSDCDSVELMMENDPTAREIRAALKPAEDRNEPNCLRCLDKKTVPSNLAEGYVMDCPECCGEEG